MKSVQSQWTFDRTMKTKPTHLILCLLTVMLAALNAAAQNIPAAHWINDAGDDVGTVLDNDLTTNAVFITSFKSTNDLVVTRLSPDSIDTYNDVFGGAYPGNNPPYLTQFVGAYTNGTGDGTPGDFTDLEMTYDQTGTLQFDFLSRLTPQDRILLVDVDGAEKYQIQAFVLTNSTYTPANLAGWVAEPFSGTTGILPDSTWPVWDPNAGTVTSGTTSGLDEEILALTPDQPIDRLVISKLAVSGWSTSVTFVSPGVATPTQLQIQRSGSNAVLSWTNALFTLQAADTVAGPYTNVIGASSPWPVGTTNQQQFFRLIAN